MTRTFLFLLCLVLPQVVLATPPPATERLGRMSDAQSQAQTDPQWLLRAERDLAARGDADSLLTAALMTYDPSQGAQYAQAASLVASKDADLAWLHWQSCAEAAHCDTSAALAWLQALEPDNAVVWLPSVAAADGLHDTRALDAALQKMASATRFDTHVFHLAQRALRVRETTPFPPKLSAQHRDDYLVDFFERSVQSMHQRGPFMEDMAALGRACGIAAKPAARVQACARIGISMQGSGTLIPMLAGSAMIAHNSDSTAIRAEAAQRERTLVWRVTHLPELARAAYDDRALARAWLDALRTQRSEDAALIVLLRYRHVPAQPPPGWRPPRPDHAR